MFVKRRDFLQGALSALGLGAAGARVFAAPPGWKPRGRQKLVFGVLSDTHLLSRPFAGKPVAGWSHRYLHNALTFFREQKVDAVVHCGDFAHRGRVRELEFHAWAWQKVFPKNRRADGREVVKLFVTGNHEFRMDCAGQRLCDKGMDVNWQRIWGEPYEPVWHKTVKGYHFFGAHWKADQQRMVEMVSSWRASDKSALGEKPFFLLSHPPLAGSTYKAFRGYSNALGFFGHWHHSAAGWREMFFIRGSSFPSVHVPPCVPLGDPTLHRNRNVAKVPIQTTGAEGRSRQGYLVRVYDKVLVIERHEFGEGGTLGPDWVMPLGKYRPHPFRHGELKKVVGCPQFPRRARLKVETVAPEGESSAGGKVKVVIPRADGNPDSRVFAYEAVIAGEPGSKKARKAVFAAGVNMGTGRETNGGVTEMIFPVGELPPGKSLIVAVRPLSPLGTFGKPIGTRFVPDRGPASPPVHQGV